MNARSVLTAASVALLVLACAHAEPFQPQAVEPGPALGAPPYQLTYNAEGDWYPTWLPNGYAIGYSYQPPEHADRDRCLAFLRPDLGRIYRMICPHDGHEWDSTNVVSSHAVSPGGRLAVVVESGDPTLYAPAYRNLWVGPVDGSDSLRVALRFPFLAPSGLLHGSAANLAWLDEQTLVYLAQGYQYIPGAIGIPPDTNDYGLEIAVLSLAGATPVLTLVPGTASATSVAVDRGTHIAYATFAGDSRVWALDLATGQRQPVIDFGTSGIVRDVQVAYNRLVAVVGGRTRPADPALFGVPVQYDEGGNLFALDLPSGAARPLDPDTTRLYRRAALSPGGDQLAAERFEVTYVDHRDPLSGALISRDTIVGKASNLWLLANP